MEKKLYADTRTLYINDKPVSSYYIGNLRYGELIAQKTPIENFKELYDIIRGRGYMDLSVEFCRGFKKIKINGTTFFKEDVKDIYLLKQSKELEADHFKFLELAKKLSAPEFIEFCKDKGLSVEFLKEEKIYN